MRGLQVMHNDWWKIFWSKDAQITWGLNAGVDWILERGFISPGTRYSIYCCRVEKTIVGHPRTDCVVSVVGVNMALLDISDQWARTFVQE